MPEGVCGYCFGSPVSICICMDCRTKKDILELKLKDALNQLVYTRRSNYQLVCENQSLRKALTKKEARKQ